MTNGADQRLRLTYVLTCGAGEDAAAKARDIAREQTVELPDGCYPADLRDRVVGIVERVEPLAGARSEAVISYDPVVAGGDLAQLVNLVFGNISMKRGILVTDIELPPSLLASCGGPRFGIQGLREVCGVPRGRPLLCVAAKPLGLSAERLAGVCYRLARAGIDIVKDDHGLANQDTAPFRERVERCQEAVEKANAETGGASRYFPNLTGPVRALAERAEFARSLGCRGVLMSPLLVGLDAVRSVAETSAPVILSHPALAGAFFRPDHGIAPHVLLGTLFRVAGSDGVIYPNVGGRFPFDIETCEAINHRLRARLGPVRPAFPVPGGGIDAARIPDWIRRYGADTIFLIGSSLYAAGDLEAAARGMVEAAARYSDERRLQGD